MHGVVVVPSLKLVHAACSSWLKVQPAEDLELAGAPGMKYLSHDAIFGTKIKYTTSSFYVMPT